MTDPHFWYFQRFIEQASRWQSLALLGIIFATWIVARRRWLARHPPPDYPRCGRCGYDVRAAPSPACPECDASLAGEWLVPASTRVPAKDVARAQWSLAVLLALIPLSAVAIKMELVPCWHVSRGTIVLNAPRSGRYDAASVIFGSVWGLARVPKLDSVSLHMGTQGPPMSRGTISLSPRRAEWGQPGYMQVLGRDSADLPPVAIPPDLPTVLAVFRLTGIDTADPAVQAEAKELHQLILDTLALPTGHRSSADPSLWDGAAPKNFASVWKDVARSASPFAYIPSLAIFWLLVWTAGMWRIARLRPKVV